MIEYIKQGWRNFRDYDAPLGRKLGMTIRNVSTRFKGNDCCGHHGEPGC